MSNKKKNSKDPFASREAKKYPNPIASREYILQFLGEQAGPLTHKEMAKALDLADQTDREALRRRLRAMLRDGQIIKNRRGGFGAVDKMEMAVGRISAHADGFGFFIPEDGSKDMFISPRQMRSVMHGDKVLARLAGEDRRGRAEAHIIEILEHNTEHVVGRFYRESGINFVIPSDMRVQDVIIPDDSRAKAKNEQIVVVQIKEHATKRSKPVGQVVEILGDHMAPGMEIEVSIRSSGLPHEWPNKVKAETSKIPNTISNKAIKGREDIRNLPLVTIDGEDAKDFDDAVFCERKGKQWRLIVAIADVASYVKPDSALDQEALNRGNSVYFPGRVIPMLPDVLSNGLCSLMPDVDRLCLCCQMIIDQTGDTKSFHFFPAVMRSHARLTYTLVGDALAGEKIAREQVQHVWPQIEELHRLYGHLHKQRKRRGAIDFDTVETRIVFGDEKKIEQIVPVQRNDGHRMIEEFMVAANVCAAKYLLKKKCGGLYRVHEGPPTDRLTDLRSFLGEFGLKLQGGKEPEARHYAQLLRQVKERDDARLIQTVLLRSMSQAIYSAENIGHFGLSFSAYSHFTSPIRRYPDLIVHRAIYQVLSQQPVAEFRYSQLDLQQIGNQSSMTERRADEATRDVVNWLKCEFMLDKVGKTFPGIIVGVTNFGMFVELDDIFVEGLVHVTALANDYYQFDPIGHRLTGERTGKCYRLGDKIKVTVAQVDLDDRKVDFIIAEEKKKPKTKRRRKKAG